MKSRDKKILMISLAVNILLVLGFGGCVYRSYQYKNKYDTLSLENHQAKTPEEFLLVAADTGDIKKVKQFIAHNVNINYANKHGFTPLILASMRGHTDVVKALVDTPNINVNAVKKDGDNALIWALRGSHQEAAQALLKTTNIDVNHADSNGDTPLMIAARRGLLSPVKGILALDKASINFANAYHETALVQAVYNGYSDVVKELLASGALDTNNAALTVAQRMHKEIPNEESYQQIIIDLQKASPALPPAPKDIPDVQ